MTKHYCQKKWLLRLSMTLTLTFFAASLFAQSGTVRVTGTVTDQSTGNPIPGVNVFVTSSQLGTVTDADGKYAIAVPARGNSVSMTFSFVGYSTLTQSVDVSGQSEVVLDVPLSEDILNLSEVVVTGFGLTSEKKQVGVLVSKVNQKDIKDLASPNALSGLSGRISGAVVTQNSGDPGGGFSVILRGISSINGSAEPLYIIDGNIVNNASSNVINLNADAQATGFQAGQNRLIDLNPNDIESIEVLKGASASAIYGSLASNGVVLIKTKRAESGEPRIDFSTSFMVSELRKDVPLNDYPFRFGFPGDERLSTVGDRLTTIADLRSAAQQAANPGTGPVSLGGRLVTNQYPVTRYNYWDDIFDTAYGTDNYISITGGNGKTNYFASTSYFRNEGILKGTEFERYGLNVKVDQSLFNDKAKLSAGVIYSNSSSQDLPNGNNFFNPISGVFIIDNVWDLNDRDDFGNLLAVERVRINPLTPSETFDITQETNRVISSLAFTYNPTDEITLDYRAGVDNTSLVGNTFQPRITYPNVAAAFFPDGYASVATNNLFQLNSNLSATYRKKFGAISTATSAGFQWLFRDSQTSIAQGRDLLPFVQTINASQNFFANPAEDQRKFSLWGWYLQETIGYNNFLFLTLSGRIDGASSFGQDERNQFYPKASTSIVLSDLDFWSPLSDTWNSFKIRASYGEAGNLTAIDEFERFTLANPVVIGTRGGLTPSTRLGQAGIRPERQKEFEIGADLSFFRNKLGLQVTYYNQRIEDLILRTAIAPSSGGAEIVRNAGEMTNKGIELQLDASIMKTKDFSWNATVIYSSFNNEVTRLLNQNINGDVLRGGGGTQSAIVGFPIGSYNVNYYARNPDGSLLLTAAGLPQIERGDATTNTPQRNAAGQPSGDPIRRVLGDPNPDWTGSVINTLAYKKFGLRVQFDAVQGFEVYNWNWVTANNVGQGPTAERELRGELPRGWVAAIGGFIGPRIQEEHVEDGSFVKLREIALSYDFGKVGPFRGLNVSAVGRNLISFDDYRGFDPETNSAGQNTRVRGDDFGNVPIPRTYQIKLSASF